MAWLARPLSVVDDWLHPVLVFPLFPVLLTSEGTYGYAERAISGLDLC